MKWSQLKKKVEDGFAESLAGRVEVWRTRYRSTEDEPGEAWVTLDAKRVWSMGGRTFEREHERLVAEMEASRGTAMPVYADAEQEARAALHARGVFSDVDFSGSLFKFINTSIDLAHESDDPILRALSLLDRRFGRRRLERFDPAGENPLVQEFFDIRHEAEGLQAGPPGAGGSK